MKKFVRLPNLTENSFASLRKELSQKLRELFDCRMQLKLGQWKKIHILRMMRRNIASIKNLLSKIDDTSNISKEQGEKQRKGR